MITWFAGLFYIVRLFIYSAEAKLMTDTTKQRILLEQYQIMKRRLWFGITWPSAIITLILGISLIIQLNSLPAWLILKLILLLILYSYHFCCHIVYKQQTADLYKYTSLQLRLWNELATLLLIAIIFAVIFKTSLNLMYLVLSILILAVLFYYLIIRLNKQRNN